MRLLDTALEPGTIVDFVDAESADTPIPNWACPIRLDAEDLLAEIAQLMPYYERARERHARTTVGVSRLSLDEAAAYVARFDSATPMANPHKDVADIALLRFAADDLKAAYLEAALASAHGPPHPSAAQVGDWLWNSTRLADALQKLRAMSLEHEDKSRRAIGTSSLVPRSRIPT